MKFLIIDGYTDEPAGLGVPPYIGTYPRYSAGVLYKYKYPVKYITIDKLRNIKDFDFDKFDVIISICGFHTPGKYLNANPATLKELVYLLYNFKGIKIIGGPASTKYGSSYEGGTLKDESKLLNFFDIVAGENLELTLMEYIKNNFNIEKIDFENCKFDENYYNKIRDIAIYGSKIVNHHPLYPNVICEIETYRGCSRHISGGCSFCTEARKYKYPIFRDEKDIIEEVKSLKENGINYFRIGRQPCIYSYKAIDSDREEVPKPNVESINKLFKGLHLLNPKVLHIDNANPKVISTYEKESYEITKILIRYCTGGNVAAFGVESFDEKVIKANNLLTYPEDVIKSIKILNELGKLRSPTGLPYFLPGINLLFGLKGERKETYSINYQYLKEILNSGYLLRRINIRQVVPFFNTDITEKDIAKFKKRKNLFKKFKEKIRNEIDNEMLKRVVPKGTVLKDVFVEINDREDLYFGRQFGSYPILVGIENKDLKIGSYVDVVITGHGKRSITGKVI